MVKNILKLEGIIDTEIKKKDNNYYFTLYTNIQGKGNYKSLVYIELTEVIFNKIKDIYKDSYAFITGSIQARNTKNNIPFIYLKAFSINFDKDNNSNKKDKKEVLPNKTEKKKNNIKYWNEYFSDEDFDFVEISKIYLIDEIHLKANIFFNSKFYNENNPIVIKKIDNNKFSLIIGFKEFFYAKLLNKTKIKAHITDLDRLEFINKYIENKNI